jgi:uncharacterized protein
MDFSVSFGGFVVGLLIGMTGMGGGLVMTPMLIFLFGVSPSVAIGTDLVYMSITKMVGAWQHWRQKTIDFVVVKYLSYGSIPGALLGVGTLALLQHSLGKSGNAVIGKLLGLSYLLVAGVMVWRILMQQSNRRPQEGVRPAVYKLVILGLVGGFLVGLTSVGSGTLFMAVLVMIYPVATAKLVGTDIVQAVLVTGVAGLAHMAAGTVNFPLVGSLLIGSIPGILIGSRLVMKLPELVIRTCLVLMLFFSGMKLL